MRIIRISNITRALVRANPHVMFMFGDNDLRKGAGGQAAEMRGEPNSVGVRTKKAPLRTPDAYWNDRDFIDNAAKIDQDMIYVERHLANGGYVAIPASGLGTGLSQMGIRCPKTAVYLNNRIEALLRMYGETTNPAHAGMRSPK